MPQLWLQATAVLTRQPERGSVTHAARQSRNPEVVLTTDENSPFLIRVHPCSSVVKLFAACEQVRVLQRKRPLKNLAPEKALAYFSPRSDSAVVIRAGAIPDLEDGTILLGW